MKDPILTEHEEDNAFISEIKQYSDNGHQIGESLDSKRTSTSIWHQIGRGLFYVMLIIFVLGIIVFGACVVMISI